MEQITIKCPVTVKAIVTDDLKKKLANELQDAIKKVDMELQQIDFQAKRIMAEQAKIDAQRLVAIRQQVDAEKAQRNDVKAEMLERLKDTAQLSIGAEIVQGQLEQILTLNVGDDLHKIMGTEVVLKDGQVVAIRG